MEKSRPSRRQKTKLFSVPQPQRYEIRRDHLFKQLEANPDHKLIAVIAPSGYGKTTFLAQYVREQSRPVAWFDLRVDHANPAYLERDVALSVMQLLPSIITNNFFENEMAFGRRAEELANHLQFAETNANFVFDGLHHFSVEASRWLQQFVINLPEGHRVYISDYNIGTFPVAQYVSRDQATLLDQISLAFSDEETKSYLQSENSQSNFQEIQSLLEGWIAAIALKKFSKSSVVQPDELIREKLEFMPDELRNFLTEASVLEFWSEDSFAQLGLCLPKKWLENSRKLGLPIAKLEGYIYKPHSIMREFFLDLLKKDIDKYRELNKKAALFNRGQDNHLEALYCWINAKDWKNALNQAEYLCRYYIRIVAMGLVRNILEKFPIELLTPMLEGIFADALFHTGETHRAEEILEKIYQNPDESWRALILLTQMAEQKGEYEKAFSFCEEALNQIHKYHGLPACGFRATKARLLERKGEIVLAENLMKEAIKIAEEENISWVLASLYTLCSDFYKSKNSSLMIHYAKKSIEILEGLKMYPRAAHAKRNLAIYFLDIGEIEKAKRLIEPCINLVKENQPINLTFYTRTAGDINLFGGNFTGAVKMLEISLSECLKYQIKSFDTSVRLRLWSAMRFTHSEFESKEFFEEIKTSISLENENENILNFYKFHESIVKFTDKELDQAYTQLNSVRGWMFEKLHLLDHWRCTAYQAEILRIKGELTFGTAQPFIQASQPYLDKNVWRVDGDILQGLFAECSRRGWLKITALENQTSFEPKLIPLQISSFGVLQVHVKNQLVRLPLTRAGEMLVYLALHGPSTRDQIIDALWSDGSDHVDYFKVVVRRLRVTLAEVEGIDFNPLPYENGLYSLNTLLDVQLDALRLTRDDLEPTEVKTLLESYTGQFMPEAEGTWVETWHAKLLEDALAAGMRLVGQLETEDPRGAVVWCEKLLKLEPLYELAHHTRVRLLQRLNDLVGVEQAQREYTRAMRDLEA
jgi:LuxR family transcriptional regulator, maltose regulon positive regulatory protein